MITSVTNVMVGKQFVIAAPAAIGDMALFDQDMKVITKAADVEAASAIYVGVCKSLDAEGNAVIEYSQKIEKNGHPVIAVGDHVDAKEATATITLTGATITPGNRYVVRIVYKDIEAANLQFTHTYEVIAESADATALATAFVEKINAHKNRRVKASNAAGVITLTALAKTDNDGVDSINTYSQVSMAVSMYETIPGALLSNQPEKIGNVEYTASNPGKGFWKQVRDAEVKNMGYKGHVFTGAYPAAAQKLMTVEGTAYDYMTIHSDNHFLSADNQYIKTTPITIEAYCPGLNEAEIITTGLKAWADVNIVKE